MGCFNTVLIDCPHCGEEIEEQSKSGSCLMESYKLDSAKAPDLMAVSNVPIECYHCGGKLIVKSDVTVVTSVEKL